MRVIACLCCLMFVGGCAAGGTYRQETYTVRANDTLYSIAWRHDVDYRELAKWNHLRSDYRLLVGQVLVLRPSGPGRRVEAHAAHPAAPIPAMPTVPRVGRLTPDGPTWVWPTDRSAPPTAVPGGGILVFGQLGQDIRAAGVGRVVYTGNGIRGYGNLIIVKHGENWLSSYAHNREMLVREGDDVLPGQIIAHMGTAAHDASALYFEIRLNGKPVDPLRFLPAK